MTHEIQLVLLEVYFLAYVCVKYVSGLKRDAKHCDKPGSHLKNFFNIILLNKGLYRHSRRRVK